MGDQVNIADLAENMIRMAGKVPHDEIEIQFTFIRAGEKLYEGSSAYFGESGRLFRSQSGHLSERSDAGCESMVEWPF